MWNLVFTGLIILGILIWYYKPFAFQQQVSTLQQGPFDLEKKPLVGSTDLSQMVLSNANTGTFQAFVYPLALQKTGKLTFCSSDENRKSGEPECISGRYSTCVCDGNDCTPCQHQGYVNILNMSNIVRVELLAAPDASRQKAATVQLVVRTVRMKQDTQVPETLEETMALPNIPLQKWTMITIAREGRRFDIYYNDSLVLSKRAQHMIDTRSAVGPIIGGDPFLNGKIALIEVYPKKLTAPEVSNIYSSRSDTNGRPNLNEAPTILKSIPVCDGGQCGKAPVIRPASPLLDWETDYA